MSDAPFEAARSVATRPCPKHMVFGPCADVGNDGSCEVSEALGGPAECLFLASAPRWGGDSPNRQSISATSLLSAQGERRPLILCELPEGPNSSSDIRRIARRMTGSVDAVLFGDSNWQRVRYPPSYRAAVLRDEGLGAWPGINCRDRNRVALEGELLALADIGVAGVHCVTGNHPTSGDRPDAAAVFDLDSTRLSELASGIGHRVSIAASPHTPPTHLRAMRTADKATAGASICMVDQPTTTTSVATFIASTRAHGATEMEFIAVIPVVLRLADFSRWSQYPNALVPPGWEQALFGAPNVPEAGRHLALQFAKELVAVDGVAGVLFGSTSDPSMIDETAAAFADLGLQLREGL